MADVGNRPGLYRGEPLRGVHQALHTDDRSWKRASSTWAVLNSSNDKDDPGSNGGHGVDSATDSINRLVAFIERKCPTSR
jgi:hypothetical protein